MPIQYVMPSIRAVKVNETGARAIGPVYTNTTQRPIQLVITMLHTVTVAGSFCLAQLNIGAVGGVAWGGWFNTPGIGIQLYSCLVGNVDPGENYDLVENAAGGTNVILRWFEVHQ